MRRARHKSPEATFYHLILWMDQFRPLSRQELRRRAYRLWGAQAELKTASWSDQAWEPFNRKLFDLSALMQHLNGEYAKWYNRRYDRRGHFWADRFKNPELLDLRALQACLLYIETNATRARLVERPEQWTPASAWLDQRHRFFSDGIAIGSEPSVARVLAQYQDQGFYLRRKHPIPQLSGQLYTLREQRSHARS